MDNSKDQSSKIADTDENPSNNTQSPVDSSLLPAVSVENGNPNRPSAAPRTPFTNLSQVDADLALARTLQDQERAYMMLRMNGDGSDHESWETGSYVHDDEDDEFDHHNSEYEGSEANEEEEDAFDVHAHLDLGSGEEDRSNHGVELDPASFPNDEAYARALQDAEDQEMAARLLALTGINEMVTEEDDDIEDHGGNSQGTWEDVDPDELSYEKQRTRTGIKGREKLQFFLPPKKELLALGEVVGTESRGLSADSISSLRSIVYKIQNNQNGSSDTCVICRLDYEDGENLILLSCKHSYHSECITNWLQINKVCPVCSTEVSTSGTAS